MNDEMPAARESGRLFCLGQDADGVKMGYRKIIQR